MSFLWSIAVITFCFGRVKLQIWGDVPWMKVSSSDIKEGERVNVLCGVPIDYTGGFCRLYRNGEKTPFKTLQTHSYTCEFVVTSDELLDGRSAGTRTTLECDYTLRNYVSMRGGEAVVVWGTAEKPLLEMSPQVVMLNGKVQVNCKSPRFKASECMAFRDTIQVDWIPCEHQMRAEKLMRWEQISLFNEISVNCKYKREGWDYIHSKRSNPMKMLVVDPTRLQISSGQTNATFVCDVPARIQDFVLLHTGSKDLSLEMGGKIILKSISNSTGVFNQTCRSI
ncbi:hypothetical protein GJAV_G00079500 [Gymnothorax javanicus]|nr:hypothetical protein GJAV_G00079500 [Gymnothorax javanicus]